MYRDESKVLGSHLKLLDKKHIRRNHTCLNCQREQKGERPTPRLKTAESLRHVWIKNNLTLYTLSQSDITGGTKSKFGDQCLRLWCKHSREVVKRHYKES